MSPSATWSTSATLVTDRSAVSCDSRGIDEGDAGDVAVLSVTVSPAPVEARSALPAPSALLEAITFPS